jgi:L-rhamnose mutarotase
MATGHETTGGTRRGSMERVLFYFRIFPGTEAEYDRRHREVWPEVQDAIRASGFRTMTGFRRGTDLWYYAEAEPDRATVFMRHDTKDIVRKWNEYFSTIIVAEPEPVFYEEVFHTDGSTDTGPSERALISLVVEPARIADYDALHANPWPDLLEAIAASGYANYSGFRRGNHVVYYGEYHPTFDAVIDRMGQTEVNARWGKAFEGIITTITDQNGRLITADEIYHQD